MKVVSEELLLMVHAFSDRERKDRVRRLSKRVRKLESDNAGLKHLVQDYRDIVRFKCETIKKITGISAY
jgi:hypothetical protein